MNTKERDLARERARCERAGPTRAHAVLAYLDAAETRGQVAEHRRKTARDRAGAGAALELPLRGRQGHPARQDRDTKRRSWYRPDKDEAHIRDMARRWREERRARVDVGDGDMSGLLYVAAQEAALELQAHQGGLDGPEHAIALATFVYGIWGELVHRFDPDLPPDRLLAGLPSYRDWRSPGA